MKAHISYYFAFLAVIAIAAIHAAGAVTNEIDIAALAACGTGVTNGWTISGIDSYGDGKVNVRVNTKDDYLDSPEFSGDVRRLIFKTTSSSQQGRHIVALPTGNLSATDSDTSLVLDYSPNNKTYVERTIEVPAELSFKSFRLALENDGSTTAWGFTALSVVTDDPPPRPGFRIVLR